MAYPKGNTPSKEKQCFVIKVVEEWIHHKHLIIPRRGIKITRKEGASIAVQQ